MKERAELLKIDNALGVDVRTREEFAGGHVAASVNIPLNELELYIAELKTKQPLVLCCASGGRSGMAETILRQADIECYNGGGWTNVNYLKNN